MCASRCAWMNSERGPGAEVRSNALTRAQCRETTQGKAHGTQAILGMAMMGTLEGRAGVSQHAISVIIPAQQRLIAQDPSRRPTAQPPNRPTAQPLSRSVAQSLSRSVAQQHRCRPASAPQVRTESPLRTATALRQSLRWPMNHTISVSKWPAEITTDLACPLVLEKHYCASHCRCRFESCVDWQIQPGLLMEPHAPL